MIYIERFRRNITCKWINLYQLCTPIQTSILVPYALSVSDNLNVGHRETVSSPSQPTLICIILKYRQISANHFEPMPEKSKKEGWLRKSLQKFLWVSSFFSHLDVTLICTARFFEFVHGLNIIFWELETIFYISWDAT